MQFLCALFILLDIFEYGIGITCIFLGILPESNFDLIHLNNCLSFIFMSLLQLLHIVAPVDHHWLLSETILYPCD